MRPKKLQLMCPHCGELLIITVKHDFTEAICLKCLKELTIYKKGQMWRTLKFTNYKEAVGN